jgi:hypothetical protein
VPGVLEHHGIIINEAVIVLVGRNGKRVTHLFRLPVYLRITELDGITTAIRTTDRKPAIQVNLRWIIILDDGMTTIDLGTVRQGNGAVITADLSGTAFPVIEITFFKTDIGWTLCQA